MEHETEKSTPAVPANRQGNAVPSVTKKKRTASRKITRGLVTLSCAAIIAVYGLELILWTGRR